MFKTTNEVRCLAKKYAVNKVVIIPIPKVIANPFTGPDPNAKRIIAAIKQMHEDIKSGRRGDFDVRDYYHNQIIEQIFSILLRD